MGLATSPVLATPTCAMTCRQETASCARTRCATLHGKARQVCVETCRGIGGCARIRTLAYRHGNCDPVPVLDFPEPWEVPPSVWELNGRLRDGFLTSPIFGAFHRMGVSPDGRHVVFEVTDDSSIVSTHLVPPGQQEGIFIVHADGRGMHRLGPASRDRSFRLAVDPASRFGARGSVWIPFSFSPGGRAVVLTDLGPGPVGQEAVQIFTLDVVTGNRIQRHAPALGGGSRGGDLRSVRGYLLSRLPR